MMIILSQILKSKPCGYPLWSPVYGECSLIGVTDVVRDGKCAWMQEHGYPVILINPKKTNFPEYVDPYGRISPYGECILFPLNAKDKYIDGASVDWIDEECHFESPKGIDKLITYDPPIETSVKSERFDSYHLTVEDKESLVARNGPWRVFKHVARWVYDNEPDRTYTSYLILKNDGEKFTGHVYDTMEKAIHFVEFSCGKNE